MSTATADVLLCSNWPLMDYALAETGYVASVIHSMAAPVWHKASMHGRQLQHHLVSMHVLMQLSVHNWAASRLN